MVRPQRSPLARHLGRIGLLVLLVASCLLPTGAASAQSAEAEDRSAEQQLAERYAPVMMLKEQEEECDRDGEGYEPMAVDSLFANPQIALRQVGNGDPTVMWAPTASDIFRLKKGFYLDFPGGSLAPGCIFERDFRAFTEDEDAAFYAHVVVQEDRPDELVLQYWSFWYFNDWNNTHEGDWELVQLVFPASTAEEALEVEPSSVGYSQHEGGERAGWDDDKLDKDGSHPIVFPSAGSHASYFGSALYLGRNGNEGFGCDNTDGPSRRIDPDVILLPEEPVSDPDSPLAWTAFSGRWGERHAGPFNGPDGPYQKGRFTRPMDWHDDLRSSSVIVPSGDSQADALVRGFCGAVEWGSNQLLQFKLSPARGFITLALIGALALYIVRRTSWKLVSPLPIVRPRRAGQIVRGSFRAFGRAPVAFAVIGLSSIPLAFLGGLIAGIVSRLPLLGSVADMFEAGDVAPVVFSLFVGSLTNILTLVVVTAAASWVMGELSAGRRPTVPEVARAVADHAIQLAQSFGRAAAVVVGLGITIIGIPFAIRQLIRYQFIPQAVMLDGTDGPHALGRSSALIKHRWWHTAVVIGTIDFVIAIAFSAIGLIVLILLRPPFWLLTIVMGAASMLVFPLAAIASTLLYGDAVHQDETAEPDTEEIAP
jgi:hypothetical protein